MKKRKISEQLICGWKMACAVFSVCAATAIASQAQVFTSLVDFDVANGEIPVFAPLVQGPDGNFYGTTVNGGSRNTECATAGGRAGCGTVFRVTPGGTLTTLYRFCSQPNCVDGADPEAGMVLAIDGNFYGTTYMGGAGPCSDYQGLTGCGTVFKITPKGTLTTLYSFCSQPNCADGELPWGAALIQAADGNFYGTTGEGGAYNGGTIFKITAGGTLTTLYSFDGTDGGDPFGGLIQAPDGNFYGTTEYGGANGPFGVVFRITPKGTLTTLYSFCSQPDCADGEYPTGLTLATDGSFYGTTTAGGSQQCDGGCGTIFKIAPSGTLTTFYSFCAEPNCADGANPDARLVQATDGNLYGTTTDGGAYGGGTVFEITAGGVLTMPYSFCLQGWPCPDGSEPDSALLQGTNGLFYGTTWLGGSDSNYCKGWCGTVFSLDTSLGPFVTFVRGAAKAGQAFGILGQGFTGTTGVSLNGIPASFTVISDTLIKATVPAGAPTGYVTVTTPTGVLTSNVPFHVLK